MNTQKMIKLGVILFVICIVAASLLSFVNQMTMSKIQEQRDLKSESMRKEVLPAAETFKAIDESKLNEIKAANEKVLEVYEGLKGDQVVGFVVKTNPSGYSGPVEITTGICAEGVITGVRVGEQKETPGLGANAKLPYFYEQYNNQKTDKPLVVVKSNPKEGEILAISGSTITSNCVTTGVNFSVDVAKMLKK